MFGRKRRPPSWARPSLDKNERIVGWSPTTGDGQSAVVVTTLGMWLPGRAERLGWHEVHKAAWSDGRLTVIPSTRVGEGDGYAVMADAAPVMVKLADPGTVPDEVRKRVTASVVHTAHYPLPGGGVRVVGRKVPGVDGLSWHVRYDEGTASDDPEIVRVTSQIVAETVASRAEE